MKRPEKLSKTFCLAPWVHAYYDSTGQRFPCSIIWLPPPQENPLNYDTQRSLKEWINSDTQINMRKDMLEGNVIRECNNCNISFDQQRRVTKTYKDYWNHEYSAYLDEVFEKTNEDGTTTFDPISFDYRTNIKCNFKCRMCTPFQSSAIYDEVINNNIDTIGYYNKNKLEDVDWITKKHYEDNILNDEFLNAAKSGNLVDINFAGGEPLLLPIHWDVLDALIENQSAKDVSIRYQSNLSMISYRDKNLKDLIKHFKKCFFQASIDAGGNAGEYLRTGLNWNKWKRNYTELHNAWKDELEINIVPQMSITIFSIFGFEELFDYLSTMHVDNIDVQLVSCSEKTILLSPHILPSDIKQKWLDYYFSRLKKYSNALHPNVYDHLFQFGEKVSIFQEDNLPGFGSWKYKNKQQRLSNMQSSYKYLSTLDNIRKTNMHDFLQDIPDLNNWYKELNHG